MQIESFGRLATAIFIFLLIISGNYLGNLFPCRIQELFEKNIWFKHFLGYFSLVFFVLITMPSDVKDVEINENNENNENNEDSNFQTLIISSFLLYIFFLILSKTPSNVWLIVFITCSIIYLLELKKEDYNKNNHSITNINQLQYILGCFILLTTFFGFLVYMGEKKIEYKKKFSYITFIFGATACRGYTHKKNTISSIKHVFD